MPVSAVDMFGIVTQLAYDERGNPTQLDNGTGQQIQVAYNQYGEGTSAVDALGRTTTFTWDDVGHRTGTSFQWVNPLDSEDIRTITTTTEYDASGRIIRSVDANG